MPRGKPRKHKPPEAAQSVPPAAPDVALTPRMSDAKVQVMDPPRDFIRGLWERQQLTDATLVCQGERFRCHSLILAAHSRHLYRTLVSLSSEVNTKVTFDLSDLEIDPGVLGSVIRFFYTGEIPQEGSVDNVVHAAEKLEVPGLLDLLKPEVSLEPHIPNLPVREPVKSTRVKTKPSSATGDSIKSSRTPPVSAVRNAKPATQASTPARKVGRPRTRSSGAVLELAPPSSRKPVQISLSAEDDITDGGMTGEEELTEKGVLSLDSNVVKRKPQSEPGDSDSELEAGEIRLPTGCLETGEIRLPAELKENENVKIEKGHEIDMKVFKVMGPKTVKKPKPIKETRPRGRRKLERGELGKSRFDPDISLSYDPDKPARRTYHCPECELTSPRLDVVQKHRLETHGRGRAPRRFQCELCGALYPSNHRLNLHRAGCAGQQRFHCDKCTRSFSQQDKFVKHQEAHQRREIGLGGNKPRKIPRKSDPSRVVFLYPTQENTTSQTDGEPSVKTEEPEIPDKKKARKKETERRLWFDLDDSLPSSIFLSNGKERKVFGRTSIGVPPFMGLEIPTGSGTDGVTEDNPRDDLWLDDVTIRGLRRLRVLVVEGDAPGDALRLQCPHCECSLAKRQGMRIHLRTVHAKDPQLYKHVCPTCSATCPSAWKLKRHMVSHLSARRRGRRPKSAIITPEVVANAPLPPDVKFPRTIIRPAGSSHPSDGNHGNSNHGDGGGEVGRPRERRRPAFSSRKQVKQDHRYSHRPPRVKEERILAGGEERIETEVVTMEMGEIPVREEEVHTALNFLADFMTSQGDVDTSRQPDGSIVIHVPEHDVSASHDVIIEGDDVREEPLVVFADQEGNFPQVIDTPADDVTCDDVRYEYVVDDGAVVLDYEVDGSSVAYGEEETVYTADEEGNLYTTDSTGNIYSTGETITVVHEHPEVESHEEVVHMSMLGESGEVVHEEMVTVDDPVITGEVVITEIPSVRTSPRKRVPKNYD